MKKSVVVTGMGIISCLGNRLEIVSGALSAGRSGIRAMPEWEEMGLLSCVAGVPDLSSEKSLSRKATRYMGDAAIYAYHAMQHALADARLSSEEISDPRMGIIMGSGVGSLFNHTKAMAIFNARGMNYVPPYVVPRIMGNSVSAVLTTAFGIKGLGLTIASACASSAHAIGAGAEQILLGKQDLVFAGGAEEVTWATSIGFDAMGALSTAYNATPQSASRPYDVSRDGFVIAGGAGMLVLEERSHAEARGADIYAELRGYGASSDGGDMVLPSAEGAARAMRLALEQAHLDRVDYINTHATSTQAGDVAEIQALRTVFPKDMPPFSSTKGLSGHPIGAAGVHEAIYSMLMMRGGFVTGTAPVQELDPALAGLPLVQRTTEARIDAFLTNSFGFGGTNASLVFTRP
jgi:3-oxoacyl-[acyl-carrier-protein] synthase I